MGKLLCLTGAALLLFIWQWLGIPCLFRSITGIPCPGCGLTRAWRSALLGDVSSAFRWHPMFWSVPVLAVYIVFDPRRLRRVRVPVLIVFAAGFLGVYLARLLGALGGFSLI